jgi:hypothetical protein
VGAATRFRGGRSGNPRGRPKGAFRTGVRVATAMLDAAAPAMTQKAIDIGLGGDGVQLRFNLARTVGTRRGQPVELALKPVKAPRDLSAAVRAVTTAVAEGRITPDEALSLSRMLDGLPRVFAAIPKPPVSETNGEDYREILIRKLDRLAARMPKEERRARLLEELAALDAEPARPGDAEDAPAP